MRGPVKQPLKGVLEEAPEPRDRPQQVTAADGRSPTAGEREQLREALHLVLSVNVYDCAGRAVTVRDMLRGSLATAVRVALNGRPAR